MLDSGAIARYLDRTYPDTPRVIPRGADVLTAAFQDALWGAFKPDWPFVPIVMRAAFENLREGSRPFFRATRELRLGPLEDLAPDGSARRAECWAKTEECFSKIAKWYERDGSSEGERMLVMGDEVSYADIIVASFLAWFREGLGEDGEEWKRMMEWDGGRWARLMAALDKYAAVDEGEDFQL